MVKNTKKKITALVSGFLFSFSPLIAYEAFAATCSCVFDATTYSAVAEGEGYCSSATKDGKHCTITFNGNLKPIAGIEPSSVYGFLNQYVTHLKAVNTELSQTHYLVVTKDPRWLIRNLPLMIRSGYATAPFLNFQEREKLDNVLNVFFKNYGNDVYNTVTGVQATFLKENFEVMKGRIKFNVADIWVDFEMSIPQKF